MKALTYTKWIVYDKTYKRYLMRDGDYDESCVPYLYPSETSAKAAIRNRSYRYEWGDMSKEERDAAYAKFEITCVSVTLEQASENI